MNPLFIHVEKEGPGDLDNCFINLLRCPHMFCINLREFSYFSRIRSIGLIDQKIIKFARKTRFAKNFT
jgi:hypothetical protein